MSTVNFDSVILTSAARIIDRILEETYTVLEEKCAALFLKTVALYKEGCIQLEAKAKVFYAEHFSEDQTLLLTKVTYTIAKIAPLALGITMLTARWGLAGVILRVALVFGITHCDNSTLAPKLKKKFAEGITYSMAIEGCYQTLAALATLAPLTAIVSATIPFSSYLLQHYAIKKIKVDVDPVAHRGN